MRITRTYTLAASAWLVLVVVGAVLVWTVISRAGQGVVTQPSSPIGEGVPITAAPHPQRAEKPKVRKSSKPRPSRSAPASPVVPSPGPTGLVPPATTPSSAPLPASPSTGTRPGPGPGPGPGPDSGSGSSPAPNNPPTSSTSSPPRSSQDSGVRRTWQGRAGVVTVECRGGSISLVGAQPNSGWSIEIDRRGPVEVRVDFDSNDGELRTRVQAECVGGTPSFEVDTSDH